MTGRNMTQLTLEARVTALESQLAELKQASSGPTREKDWRRTIGMFAGDEIMQRIFDEAQRIRNQDRRKVRPRPNSKPRRKK